MKFSALALVAVATFSAVMVSADPLSPVARTSPRRIIKPAYESKGDDYDVRPAVLPIKVKPYGGGESNYGDGYNNHYDQYDNGYNVGRKSGYGEGYNLGSKDGFSKGAKKGSYKGERQGVVTGWNDGVQDGIDKGYWTGYNKAEAISEKKGETAGFKQGFELGEKSGYELGMKQGFGLAVAEAGTGKYGDLVKGLQGSWKQYYKGGSLNPGSKGNYGSRNTYEAKFK
jgi:hypothetical protein